jgi:hypothetical protein
MTDFKTIIVNRCTCDGTLCKWCERQEEIYYSDKYEVKTHLKELFLEGSIL